MVSRSGWAAGIALRSHRLAECGPAGAPLSREALWGTNLNPQNPGRFSARGSDYRLNSCDCCRQVEGAQNRRRGLALRAVSLVGLSYLNRRRSGAEC